MISFAERRTRPHRSDDFADLQEEFKSKIKDLHWLVYFFEDGKLMIVSAGFSGTEANLAQRALAKVGDVFTFNFLEKTTLVRYTGRIKGIGLKSYMEKCLSLLSLACKEQSGEPDLDFSLVCSSSPVSTMATLNHQSGYRIEPSDNVQFEVSIF